MSSSSDSPTTSRPPCARSRRSPNSTTSWGRDCWTDVKVEMETKRVITAVLVALAAILIYYQVLGYLERKYGWNQPPAPTATTSPAPRATQATTQNAAPATGLSSTGPVTGPTIA